MAITWQEHRENSWQEHGKAMAGGMSRARQERGKSTAIIASTQLERYKGMARAKEEHGKPMTILCHVMALPLPHS
jgi:hypothetical protein